jgi:hypothetical protein
MKESRRASALIWLFTVLASTTIAYAQFDVAPTMSTMYDDNISNNYLGITDRVVTLNLNTGYNFGGVHWDARVFYDGAATYYQSVADRSNQFHSGNVRLSHYSGEDEEDVLHGGLSFGQGVYRGAYTFYDHSQLSAFVQYKHYLSDRVINNVGYVFRSVRFAQLSDFSYSEHALTGSLSFALPTQTTLILQTDLGAKFYSTSIPMEAVEGTRKGQMSIAPGVTQLTPLIRIGQSMAEGTGLSFMTKYQWNIQKQSRYLTSDYGVVSDDELFDDHYGYEGFHTSLMLTQVLPASMLLRATGGIQNKLYSSLAAYDLDGNMVASQRSDQRAYLTILLQKSFENGFMLKAAYDLIRNSSNDGFYDYRNNALTMELSLAF